MTQVMTPGATQTMAPQQPNISGGAQLPKLDGSGSAVPQREAGKKCSTCNRTVPLSKFSDGKATCNNCRNRKRKYYASTKEHQGTVLSYVAGVADQSTLRCQGTNVKTIAKSLQKPLLSDTTRAAIMSFNDPRNNKRQCHQGALSYNPVCTMDQNSKTIDPLESMFTVLQEPAAATHLLSPAARDAIMSWNNRRDRERAACLAPHPSKLGQGGTVLSYAVPYTTPDQAKMAPLPVYPRRAQRGLKGESDALHDPVLSLEARAELLSDAANAAIVSPLHQQCAQQSDTAPIDTVRPNELPTKPYVADTHPSAAAVPNSGMMSQAHAQPLEKSTLENYSVASAGLQQRQIVSGTAGSDQLAASRQFLASQLAATGSQLAAQAHYVDPRGMPRVKHSKPEGDANGADGAGNNGQQKISAAEGNLIQVLSQLLKSC